MFTVNFYDHNFVVLISEFQVIILKNRLLGKVWESYCLLQKVSVIPSTSCMHHGMKDSTLVRDYYCKQPLGDSVRFHYYHSCNSLDYFGVLKANVYVGLQWLLAEPILPIDYSRQPPSAPNFWGVLMILYFLFVGHATYWKYTIVP